MKFNQTLLVLVEVNSCLIQRPLPKMRTNVWWCQDVPYYGMLCQTKEQVYLTSFILWSLTLHCFLARWLVSAFIMFLFRPTVLTYHPVRDIHSAQCNGDIGSPLSCHHVMMRQPNGTPLDDIVDSYNDPPLGITRKRSPHNNAENDHKNGEMQGAKTSDNDNEPNPLRVLTLRGCRWLYCRDECSSIDPSWARCQWVDFRLM